jgi:hypothetical protein
MGRIARADVVAAAVLALAVAGAGALRIVPGVVGGFHDDAIYAITAKALAQGDGYRLINLPGAPPQTKYPILYPAVLATLWPFASSLAGRLAAMQLATLAMAAAAIAVAFLYVVRFRYVGRDAAFGAGLVCASAPNLLYYATGVLSEMPFALAVTASLWVTDAWLAGGASPTSPAHTAPPARAPGDARRALLVGVAAGVPFLCRSAGAVVPVAAVVAARAARRPVSALVAGAAAVMAPWMLWAVRGVGSFAATPIVGYQEDYLGHWSTAYFGDASQPRLVLAAKLVAANVGKACVAMGHIALEGVTRAAYDATDLAWLLAAATGAAAWITIVVRARRLGLLPITLVFYLALVCAWPWPPDRFMIPVLFFVVATLCELIGTTARRLAPPRTASIVLATFVAVAIAANGVWLSRYVTASRASHYPYFAPPDEPVAWTSYTEAFAWLRTHTGDDEVLAAGFDSMTALFTGRPTIRPFVARPSVLFYGGAAPPVGTPAELATTLAAYRPRYLFVSPMPAFAEEDAFYELVVGLQRERPGMLQPVYAGRDPRFAIFAVNATEAGGAR